MIDLCWLERNSPIFREMREVSRDRIAEEAYYKVHPGYVPPKRRDDKGEPL